MKRFKKLTALLVALAMMIALMPSAFAATVTISGEKSNLITGHKFVAYQIFSGKESNGILSDVDWGANVNKDTILQNLQGSTLKVTKDNETVTLGSLFEGCDSAAAVAKVIATLNESQANVLAKFFDSIVTESGTELSTEGTECISRINATT